MIGILGLFVMPFLAWCISVNRRAIPWRTVLTGTGLQLLFALLILKTPWGRAFFVSASEYVNAFLNFNDAGASFIFGEGFEEHYFAFKVLTTIIFFSSFISVLYHFGIVQWVVRGFAVVMMKLLRTSGAPNRSALRATSSSARPKRRCSSGPTSTR